MPLTSIARKKMGWRKGKTFTAYYKKCEVCGKEFKTVPSSSKQYTCSRECLSIRYQTLREKKCEYCGEKYTAKKGKKTTSRFCGKSCAVKARDWKPSLRKIIATILPRSKMLQCEQCGYNKYPEILERHHKDRDRNNNTQENLQALCPNCHDELHYLEHTGKWWSNRKEA